MPADFLGVIIAVVGGVGIVIGTMIMFLSKYHDNQQQKEQYVIKSYDRDDIDEEEIKTFEENESDVWYAWHKDIAVTQNDTITHNGTRNASRTVYSQTIEQFYGIRELPAKITWKIKVHKKNPADTIGITMGTHGCTSIFNQSMARHNITSQVIRNAGADYYAITCNGKKQSRRKTLTAYQPIKYNRNNRTYNFNGFYDQDIVTIEFDIVNAAISLWQNNNYIGKIFDKIELPRRKTGRCRLAISLRKNSSYSLIHCSVVKQDTANFGYVYTPYGHAKFGGKTVCTHWYDHDQLQSMYDGKKQWDNARKYNQNNPWCDWADCMTISENYQTIKYYKQKTPFSHVGLTKGMCTKTVAEFANMNMNVDTNDTIASNSKVVDHIPIPNRILWIVKFVTDLSNNGQRFNIFNKICVGNGIYDCDIGYCLREEGEFVFYQSSGSVGHYCLENRPTKCSHRQHDGNRKYCDQFSNGDVIIVDVNVKDNTLSFWRNNKNLGVAFENILKKPKDVLKWRVSIMVDAPAGGSCSLLSCKMGFDHAILMTGGKGSKQLVGYGNLLQSSSKTFEQIEAKLSLDKIDHTEANKLSQAMEAIDKAKQAFDEQYDKTFEVLKEKIEKSQVDLMQSYKKWDVNDIISWIKSLENGRFIKYCDLSLTDRLKKENVVGKNLSEMTRSDLRMFGVENFGDSVALEKHCQSLKSAADSEATTTSNLCGESTTIKQED